MYVIETERLALREYTQDDFDALYEILGDAETMKHYPQPYNKVGTQRWLDWSFDNYKKYGFGLWAVTLKSTGEFIGDCGITMQNIDGHELPEVGYHIHKNHWRHGYAHEAAAAVLEWGMKNTEFPHFYSYCNYTNVASYKTAESIGMHFEKEFVDEHGQTTHVSMITRDEYLKKTSIA
ncbi:MAG: GNAT family N-acetyltransferase [Lachnospiraceae bacterium]|nr:GNAT family N-acetyltransferase [Lachnospiraceae bacterium]MBR5762435.1 GNAT family N-acetyltransferase [Lachnospiraceae bacterium]